MRAGGGGTAAHGMRISYASGGRTPPPGFCPLPVSNARAGVEESACVVPTPAFSSLRGCNHPIIGMMVQHHSTTRILGPLVAFDGLPSRGADQGNQENQGKCYFAQITGKSLVNGKSLVICHWQITAKSLPNHCQGLQFSTLANHCQITAKSLPNHCQITGKGDGKSLPNHSRAIICKSLNHSSD